MASEDLFARFQTGGIKTLNSILREKFREDLYLDYKRKSRPSTPTPGEDDMRNFSKALSGFANSDGGLLIWGVDAPGTGAGPRLKKPLADAAGFAGHLDSLTSRMVTPRVEGVENLVLRDGRRGGFVVTYIPRSVHAPHRAEHHAIRKYYQRSGDSFLQMEHWQLEFMFGRRLVPELKPAWDVADHVVQTDPIQMPRDGILPPARRAGDRQNAAVKVRVGVQNKGKAIARYVCLRLYYKKNDRRYILREDSPDLLIHYSPPTGTPRGLAWNEMTARATPGLVIYPGDRTSFFEFSIRFTLNEIHKRRLKDLSFFYDLFAENFRGIMEQKMVIPGEAITRILLQKYQTRNP